MKVNFVKSLWGMIQGQTPDDKLRLIRQAGYDGVEGDLPDMDPTAWKDLCGKHSLNYVAMIFAADGPTFVADLRKAARYGPVLVNCHSGRDKMTFEEGCAFFETALKAEADVGIPVAHETHRHRLFYAPWTTVRYLERFPDLKITADYSHWCVVCESLLVDLGDLLAATYPRAIHIHGRIGHEEGPQVPDPRAPEYARCVEAHERWWDAIRDAQQHAGADMLTFDPEFGPWGYMPCLPYTRQPVADLWDLCLWTADRIRKRWKC